DHPPAGEVAAGGAPGPSRAAPRAEDDVRLGDEPDGFEGEQLLVAGADADAVEEAAHPRSTLAARTWTGVSASQPRRPASSRPGGRGRGAGSRRRGRAAARPRPPRPWPRGGRPRAPPSPTRRRGPRRRPPVRGRAPRGRWRAPPPWSPCRRARRRTPARRSPV